MISLHFLDGHVHIKKSIFHKLEHSNLEYYILYDKKALRNKKKEYFRLIRLFLENDDCLSSDQIIIDIYNKLNGNIIKCYEFYKDLIDYGLSKLLVLFQIYLYINLPNALPLDHLEMAYNNYIEFNIFANDYDDNESYLASIHKYIKKMEMYDTDNTSLRNKDNKLISKCKELQIYDPPKYLEDYERQIYNVYLIYKNTPIITLILSQIVLFVISIVFKIWNIWKKSKDPKNEDDIENQINNQSKDESDHIKNDMKLKLLSKFDIRKISELVFCSKGFIGILYRYLFKTITTFGILKISKNL